MHWTDVEDDHEAVLQPSTLMTVLAVKLVTAKLSPETVTDEPPDMAPFANSWERTGASKETANALVPATAATVTCMPAAELPILVIKQFTEVLEDHCAVEHATSANTAVTVKPTDPKFRPVTVTDVRAEWAMFTMLLKDETRYHSA